MSSSSALRSTVIIPALLCLLVCCLPGAKIPCPDRSIVTHDPCAPPCWQGIEPGQTSIEEAFATVEGLGFKPKRAGESGVSLEWPSRRCDLDSVFPPLSNFVGSLTVAGPVGLVDLSLEFEFPVADMLGKYGQPEKYQVYESEGTTQDGSHIPIVAALFVYAQQGLVFTAWLPWAPGSGTMTLDSDSVIERVSYFEPTTADRLAESVWPLKRRIKEDRPLLDWTGLPITVTWER